MLRAIERLLVWLGLWHPQSPPGPRADPYAWKPAPRKPPPAGRSGSVAVAEPDDD